MTYYFLAIKYEKECGGYLCAYKPQKYLIYDEVFTTKQGANAKAYSVIKSMRSERTGRLPEVVIHKGQTKMCIPFEKSTGWVASVYEHNGHIHYIGGNPVNYKRPIEGELASDGSLKPWKGSI